MSEKFISPVYGVRAVPIEKIRANSYNPNAVAPTEMKLLYDSIKEDGYTMPTVCYYIKEEDIYEIVDGFHRYMIMKTHRDIYEREGGKLPCRQSSTNRWASAWHRPSATTAHEAPIMLTS